MTKEQAIKLSAELAALSKALLELHKELLAFERKRYESLNGDIGSNNNFLTLLMSHQAFNWLRKLSGLIVVIDEMIDSTEKNPSDLSPREVALDIEKLLTPDEQGSEFSQKYHTAITNEPNIAIAHGEALNKLKIIIAEAL